MKCTHEGKLIILHYATLENKIVEYHCKKCSVRSKECGCLNCMREQERYFVVSRIDIFHRNHFFFFCSEKCYQKFEEKKL